MELQQIYIETLVLNSRSRFFELVPNQPDFAGYMYRHCMATMDLYRADILDCKSNRGLLQQVMKAHGCEAVFVSPLPKGKGGKS